MTQTLHTALRVTIFAAAFAFVESSVVVYLRALYYPEGFSFPLKPLAPDMVAMEIVRECSTIIMLAAVGALAGRSRWEKFSWFLIAFGVWDILYYVWLKVTIGWPATMIDWDVLFLVPLPWIGPVIAPVLIALLMVILGILAVFRLANGRFFHPGWLSWILALAATIILLYSFMLDIPATLGGQPPSPYPYQFLAIGLLLYGWAFVLSCRERADSRRP